MDLGAYAQIGDLQKVADKNGIHVDRLRGYRLMAAEQPIDNEELSKMKADAEYDAITECVESGWNYNSPWLVSNYYTSRYLKKHRTLDTIHGNKRRKQVKYTYKKICKKIDRQYGMWNKYAGQPGILYIHAKLGSTNWSDITHEYYKNEPWYLDSCDDYWDSSYCDIYAKIGVDNATD